MRYISTHPWAALLVAAAIGLATPLSQADAVTDWNTRAGDIVAAGKLPPHPSYRATAIVQMAMYEAVTELGRKIGELAAGRYATAHK